MKTLTPAQRLIVAADFKPTAPDGRAWVESQILTLAEKLRGTGVCLKVNSALRALGYGLIEKIHDCGLGVFADLKLFDIGETLSIDGELLRQAKPELLTAVCATGIEPLHRLKAQLPDTEVLGVTVLTSLTDDDTRAMFCCSVEDAVLRFAKLAVDASIDGVISSAKEARMVRANIAVMMTINTPAIRPAWATVSGDDQNFARIMTPAEAIRAGADRIIVGRPITRADNPHYAVMRTIDEIVAATA